MAAELTKADIRSVLADALEAIEDASVAVVIGTSTGNGIRGPRDVGSDLQDIGEMGMTKGSVRVSMNDFAEPARGASITVDGNTAFVISATPDELDALMLIEYTDRQEYL
jgi:hypothetical protein